MFVILCKNHRQVNMTPTIAFLISDLMDYGSFCCSCCSSYYCCHRVIIIIIIIINIIINIPVLLSSALLSLVYYCCHHAYSFLCKNPHSYWNDHEFSNPYSKIVILHVSPIPRPIRPLVNHFRYHRCQKNHYCNISSS